MAGLTAEEFQLLREAVDERRCRDGTGAGVHSEAGAPYRRTWNARGTALAAPGGTVSSLPTSRSGAAAVAAGGSPPQGHRPRALPNAAPRLGLLNQAHAPHRPRRVCGRAVWRQPQDGLRVAAPHARHGNWLPGPVCTVRHILIDETRINDTDPSKGYEQVHKRSLFREKPCV